MHNIYYLQSLSDLSGYFLSISLPFKIHFPAVPTAVVPLVDVTVTIVMVIIVVMAIIVAMLLVAM